MTQTREIEDATLNTPEEEKENIRIVRQIFEAFNTGNMPS
jgi:hypothetical protein